MSASQDSTATRARRGTEFNPDDPRIVNTVREYLEKLETGQVPDRDAFINRYPVLSTAIRECLDGLELVHKTLQAEPPPRPAAPEFPAADLPIPGGANLLGDFRILREIGRGGMGIVYEAEQLSLG